MSFMTYSVLLLFSCLLRLMLCYNFHEIFTVVEYLNWKIKIFMAICWFNVFYCDCTFSNFNLSYLRYKSKHNLIKFRLQLFEGFLIKTSLVKMLSFDYVNVSWYALEIDLSYLTIGKKLKWVNKWKFYKSVSHLIGSHWWLDVIAKIPWLRRY